MFTSGGAAAADGNEEEDADASIADEEDTQTQAVVPDTTVVRSSSGAARPRYFLDDLGALVAAASSQETKGYIATCGLSFAFKGSLHLSGKVISSWTMMRPYLQEIIKQEMASAVAEKKVDSNDLVSRIIKAINKDGREAKKTSTGDSSNGATTEGDINTLLAFLNDNMPDMDVVTHKAYTSLASDVYKLCSCKGRNLDQFGVYREEGETHATLGAVRLCRGGQSSLC